MRATEWGKAAGCQRVSEPDAGGLVRNSKTHCEIWPSAACKTATTPPSDSGGTARLPWGVGNGNNNKRVWGVMLGWRGLADSGGGEAQRGGRRLETRAEPQRLAGMDNGPKGRSRPKPRLLGAASLGRAARSERREERASDGGGTRAREGEGRGRVRRARAEGQDGPMCQRGREPVCQSVCQRACQRASVPEPAEPA